MSDEVDPEAGEPVGRTWAYEATKGNNDDVF